MRALLAFLLLALLPAVAAAQPTKPDFWPAPLSPYASRPLTETNSDGICWGYVSRRKADNAVMINRWCGLRAQWPNNWFDEAARLLVGTDAERDAAWAKYTGASGWDWRMNGPAAALLTRLQAPDLVPPPWPGDPPPPPAPPAEVWKVAPNSTYPTRPTYLWSNGTRSTVAASERVPVGSECSPAVGAGDYRGVLGRADRVALCRKQ